jgi:uncharacterized membrane protein/glutaredoxin
MMRRRSTPWIHRWSRPAIAAIAGVGALVTAYLTIEKLMGRTPACLANAVAETGSGCADVLSSPWATVFGLPLALFGFLAYTSMVVFALAPLAVNPSKNKALRAQLENWTWLLLLAGAIAMSVFSGYLMYVLFTKINALCLYCIASALFSVSMLVLTLLGRTWEDIGQILFTALVVGIITIVGTLAVYADVEKPTNTAAQQVQLEPVGDPIPGVGWQITTTSGESEIALAKHLKEVGAKEYIAWWCPHCHEQKQLFGKEAYSYINHIECAPPGAKKLAPECEAAKIQSFPTWEINGKQYAGVKSLKELAAITGYKGSTDFKNFPNAFQ